MSSGACDPALHQKLSVIVTVRNEKAGIRGFVDSLLAQQLPPDEIVIVDGQSTDGTAEILREYAQAGKIKLVCEECNIAQGRNLGVRHARNELIAVTDAGCVVDRAWLKSIAECFASADRPDVVAGNYEFDARTSFEQACVLATDTPHRTTTDIARYHPSSRSVAFRKSAWAKVKGYPEWLYAAEDTLFNVRLRQLGCRFHFAKNAIVRWRPRQTWRALFRQFFNYARGNGRVGLSTSGYLLNIQYHAAVLLLLIAGLFWPLALIPAVLIFVGHVRQNLWDQASQARKSTGDRKMRWRVLAIMEAVRLAGIAGFIAGKLDRIRDPSFVRNQKAWMDVESLDQAPSFNHVSAGILVMMLGLTALSVQRAGVAVLTPAALVTAFLALKSAINFSRTGPELKHEIAHAYIGYSMLAIGRLMAWAFLVSLVMAGAGILVYQSVASTLELPLNFAALVIAGLSGILIITSVQFLRHLLDIPGSIAASLNYRISRLYPVWSLLSPPRLSALTRALSALAAVAVLVGMVRLSRMGDWGELAIIALIGGTYVLLAMAAVRQPEPVAKPLARGPKKNMRPNVVMIGADTLRADRLETTNPARQLTPFLKSLMGSGTYLANCYVPCARTAPSLASLLTGTWPHKHGIRDNFSTPEDANADVPCVPRAFRHAGYRTIAVSDWCGADLAKYDFGFDRCDLPQDQWNIKYLIRQGPKDIRLFMSLFTHGQFGKRFLPELYYLAGVPMTAELGRVTREILSEQAQRDEPFMLNVFMSTTHAPFGSEYPYYTLFADHDYRGESKFVMARLTEPFEIIRRQRDPRSEFDLDQIIDLYDGCVRRFDDEVAKIVRHLRDCGLAENTIVVIYSDHGMEFFERETWGQGNSVIVDESSRIPLIIVDPRRPGGGRIDKVTRSIDVAATLLELVGIPVPPEMDGVSLVTALNGERSDLNLAAYSETGIWFSRLPGISENHLRYPDLSELLEVPDKRKGSLEIKEQFKDIVIRAKDRMIRVGRWKLVYFPMRDGPVYHLFDVDADPLCTCDLSDNAPEILAELKARLEQGWLAHDLQSHA